MEILSRPFSRYIFGPTLFYRFAAFFRLYSSPRYAPTFPKPHSLRFATACNPELETQVCFSSSRLLAAIHGVWGYLIALAGLQIQLWQYIHSILFLLRFILAFWEKGYLVHVWLPEEGLFRIDSLEAQVLCLRLSQIDFISVYMCMLSMTAGAWTPTWPFLGSLTIL